MSSKLLSVPVSIVLLAGCASSANYVNNVERIKDRRSEDSSAYSHLDSRYVSDELKLMTFLGDSSIKPINANNLDRYASDYNPHAFSDGLLGGGAVLALAGGMNILQLGTFSVSNSLSRIDMQESFTRTQVLHLVPINGMSDEEVVEAYESARINVKEEVLAALGDSGGVFTSEDGLHNYIFNTNSDYCVNSTFADSKFDYGSCYTYMTNHIDMHRTGAKNVPYTPSEEFLVVRANLEIGFPIENLSFTSGNPTFLYMSPWGETPEFYTKRYNYTEEQWVELFRTDRLSILPYLKDLNTGKVHYFNKKLASKFQPDEFSVIR
ncbi:hypothetical protein [Vibrio agarivorans]|uniref:hypothetical protein n=1 Tax=Vibrio agarivorans TaxID=153622 RepID=UPI0025B400CD|nr:hypothetical protein [Vibrio agarivorans]MDN3663541.1 hypothetical protein [Vibrio agarivorans]